MSETLSGANSLGDRTQRLVDCRRALRGLAVQVPKALKGQVTWRPSEDGDSGQEEVRYPIRWITDPFKVHLGSTGCCSTVSPQLECTYR